MRSLLSRSAVTFAALAYGCGGAGEAPGGAGPTVEPTAFRVRAEAGAGLDADTGWAAPQDADATVATERPFRVRFELRGGGGSSGTRFRLQYRRDGEAWTDVPAADFPYPEARTPRISVVDPRAYPDGAPTGDLLAGSEAPLRPGAGIALDSITPAWGAAGADGAAEPVQGEWEWPLVVRRFADGAVTNDEGDTFELRMVSVDGAPLGPGPGPTLTVTVPARQLGGTFVETPGRLGPWEASNGDLYFVMEPSETDNVLMVVKSEDRGTSWREVDGAGRPAADDLEGFATAMDPDGRIHMLHQQSEAVWYHAFDTSDAPESPDGWAVRDELVARPGEPPTQVAALALRPGGDLVAVYGGPERLRIRVRAPGGGWGEEAVVEADGPGYLTGPQLTAGPDGTVHLAYTLLGPEEGSVWYRRFEPGGILSPAVRLAGGVGTTEEDAGAVAPLVHLPDADEVVVVYRLADGLLRERRIAGGGEPSEPVLLSDRVVVQSAVDSDQVGADAVAHEGAVHVLFIEEGSGTLFHVRSDAPGAWSEPAVAVDGIDAQWVRGNVLVEGDAGPVYGFVYDAGSDGGTGMNRYGEVALGGG